MPTHSTAVRTRAEMQAEYGLVPSGKCKTWTIHRSHGSVTYVTDDGGDHWVKKSFVTAAQRAWGDEHALEMERIQREEK